MFASGITAGSDEVVVRITVSGEVPGAVTVKGRGPVEEFGRMNCLAMSESVGSEMMKLASTANGEPA